MRPSLVAAVLLASTLAAGAEETDPAAFGDLNPDEMSINRVLRDTARGVTSMSSCASGYFITKAGRHVEARQVFTACVADGYTGAMTWMSQLDDNGLGAPEDPQSAAAWDRRAAEAGDPVGLFNYGLDMLRGRGVARDVETGQRLIDEAAAMGLPTARRLQGAGYDPEEVTPDADSWKYLPLF